MTKILRFAFVFLVVRTNIIAQSPFAGGSGIAADPYLISTSVQLDSVRHHRTSTFAVDNDIDLNVAPYDTGEGWLPLGDCNSPFNGTFHGRGHIIRSLYINRSGRDTVGFFGTTELNSKIDSLGLKGCNITGNKYVGGFVGYQNRGTITSFYSTSNVSGETWVSGLVGYQADIITSCYSKGNVSGTENYVGGLVGYQEGSTTTLLLQYRRCGRILFLYRRIDCYRICEYHL